MTRNVALVLVWHMVVTALTLPSPDTWLDLQPAAFWCSHPTHCFAVLPSQDTDACMAVTLLVAQAYARHYALVQRLRAVWFCPVPVDTLPSYGSTRTCAALLRWTWL